MLAGHGDVAAPLLSEDPTPTEAGHTEAEAEAEAGAG